MNKKNVDVNVIDHLVHQFVAFIQYYGWYIVFALIVWYNIQPYVMEKVHTFLNSFKYETPESIERTRLLNREVLSVRQRQQEEFEIGVNNNNVRLRRKI